MNGIEINLRKWVGAFLHRLVPYLAAGLLLTAAACASATQISTSPASSTADPAIGPVDASVTIVEYGDFGCPTCKFWHQSGVLQQILDHYGGQVRFVWRDLPIITPQSPKAAEAGQCANAQGKFWEYHDLLYARAPALSISDLKSYAAELGLDAAIFNQCLDSNQFQAKVAQSQQDAFSLGMRATPSFLVNSKVLVGPLPFDQFQSFIDPLLK